MHPSVRILALCAFGALLPWLSPKMLATVIVLLAGVLPWKGGAEFVAFVRRARWLLASILLIYAYATPGEYVAALPEQVAPTYEGLRDGVFQAIRLLCMLGALSVLLATTTREAFVAGIMLLLAPLRPCGLDPERFAVRLWLTIHYVEHIPQGLIRQLRQQGWRLDAASMESDGPQTLRLVVPPLRWYDVGVLLSIALLFWLLV
jgi:energy-coupling factor transport system permease protein